MMEKFPFTPAGVQEMNDYLYAQTDAELGLIIDEVQHDLIDWMKDTFILEPDQVDFMEALDPSFLFVLSNQLAATMTLRLPIRLVKPDKPEGPVVFGAKRGGSHNPINVGAAAGQKPEATGEFVFTISY